jgi:hypothetical protein
LRKVEQARLGLLAALPTARTVTRNRVRASPLAQRLLAQVGKTLSDERT